MSLSFVARGIPIAAAMRAALSLIKWTPDSTLGELAVAGGSSAQ